MANKKVKVDFDDSALYDDEPTVGQMRQMAQSVQVAKEEPKVYKGNTKGEAINCLRNEKIIVRFVPKKTDNIADKRHVAYGGMMNNATRVFVPPMLSSGSYKNCLTDNEKAYLEDIMGLDYNALSVHKKENNFWDTYKVRLYKHDNILDLSDPADYIKYKVLLANKDLIAPSLSALKNNPKATYQYVIIEEGDENVSLKDNVNTVMKCYEELGRIKDDFNIMKYIIETLDGRTVAANTKIEFLQAKAHEFITENSKIFLNTITDELLSAKVLIKKAIEAGIISKRGDYYYLREDGSPLCGNGEDPTITVAAKYLSLPKNQELKFAIEAKLK